MSSASPTLEQHLAILRERMQHPTAYDRALDYFLNVFAEDTKVSGLGERDESLGLRHLLTEATCGVLGKRTQLTALVMLHVREHGFYHGCAAANGRLMMFFYCKSLDTGIMGLVPGLKGPTEAVRFRLSRSPNPQVNN